MSHRSIRGASLVSLVENFLGQQPVDLPGRLLGRWAWRPPAVTPRCQQKCNPERDPAKAMPGRTFIARALGFATMVRFRKRDPRRSILPGSLYLNPGLARWFRAARSCLETKLHWIISMIRIAKTNGVVRLPKAKNVLGGKLADLLHLADDRLFPRRLLQHGAGRRRLAHRVRRADGRVPGVFQIGRQRPLDAEPAMGLPRPATGRPLVPVRPRWQEALDAGFAPKVVLSATHEAALAYCDLEDLKAHAVDG